MRGFALYFVLRIGIDYVNVKKDRFNNLFKGCFFAADDNNQGERDTELYMRLVVCVYRSQCTETNNANFPQPNENKMVNYNAFRNDVNQIAEIERPPLATHVPLVRRFKQTATQDRQRFCTYCSTGSLGYVYFPNEDVHLTIKNLNCSSDRPASIK